MAKKDEFDAMGQPVGTPRDETQGAEPSTLKPLVDVAPKPKANFAQAAPMPDPELSSDLADELLEEEDEAPAPAPKAKAKAAAPDIKDQIREALRDPELAREFVATASQDPGLRKILNLPADSVPPSGHYERNYHAEPALRVYGGVEVEHEKGFETLPAGYLTKFVAEDAEIGKTDNLELAKLDAAGKPVKTEEYKQFLDQKNLGKRLGGNVRFDIEAGDFTPGDVGVAV